MEAEVVQEEVDTLPVAPEVYSVLVACCPCTCHWALLAPQSVGIRRPWVCQTQNVVGRCALRTRRTGSNLRVLRTCRTRQRMRRSWSPFRQLP